MRVVTELHSHAMKAILIGELIEGPTLAKKSPIKTSPAVPILAIKFNKIRHLGDWFWQGGHFGSQNWLAGLILAETLVWGTSLATFLTNST